MDDVRQHKAAISWPTWEAAVQLVIFNLVSFQFYRSKSLFSLRAL